MSDSLDQPTDEGPSEKQELAEILAGPGGELRHHRLENFVAARPSSGLGHLYLGLSYLLNRFSPTLDLPPSIMVLGGPEQAPREMVGEHLERAEEHFKRAMELDPALTADATANLAACKLATNRYGPAIVYIEELLKRGDHPQAALLTQHLGIAYREMGEYDVALRLFQSLLESELKFVHRHLALTHLCRDELAKTQAEVQEQLRLTGSEIDQLLARAVEAEIQGHTDEAVRAYRELASICRFDSQKQITGINAARRAASLAGDHEWKLSDYCDELAY